MTIDFNRDPQPSIRNVPMSRDSMIENPNRDASVRRYQITANVVNVYHNQKQPAREKIAFDSSGCFNTNILSIPFDDVTQDQLNTNTCDDDID